MIVFASVSDQTDNWPPGARWSKARPLSKRKRERLQREVAKTMPEDRKREAKEFAKELSGFMNLYKDRPMD
jgi:hypothetical protein